MLLLCVFIVCAKFTFLSFRLVVAVAHYYSSYLYGLLELLELTVLTVVL